MKRFRKKKSQKRAQKREGRSEVSERREGRHRDHREVGEKSNKELIVISLKFRQGEMYVAQFPTAT